MHHFGALVALEAVGHDFVCGFSRKLVRVMFRSARLRRYGVEPIQTRLLHPLAYSASANAEVAAHFGRRVSTPDHVGCVATDLGHVWVLSV